MCLYANMQWWGPPESDRVNESILHQSFKMTPIHSLVNAHAFCIADKRYRKVDYSRRRRRESCVFHVSHQDYVIDVTNV